MNTRVLESGKCNITQGYNSNHQAVDMVDGDRKLDYVVAHTEGKVIILQDGYNNIKGSTGNTSYGNFVKIEHKNGYATLYAHMQKGLLVKNGEYVEKGQRLGYMGDSGNAYGAHLHFEVWKDGVRINPENYINSNLYNEEIKQKYKVGDKVTINGVFVSSESTEKLNPLIKTGTITKIINNVRNPYLLDNGNIGWVNDSVILNNNYLSNPNYKGTSIVDALNEINIDSSYNYRTKLANVNGINNYTGSAEQNTKLLNLLKKGILLKI
mgnify:FL=1